MKKLFKASYWLMLIGMIFCLLAYLILFVVFPDKFFWIIPVCCTFALEFISEFFGEKMYNHSERKKELKETSTNLDKYIESIKNTLEAHGIVTKEQRQILKSECENNCLCIVKTISPSATRFLICLWVYLWVHSFLP